MVGEAKNHLKPLQRRGRLSIWDDTQNTPRGASNGPLGCQLKHEVPTREHDDMLTAYQAGATRAQLCTKRVDQVRKYATSCLAPRAAGNQPSF